MKKKWRHWALCAVLAVGSALGASLLSDIRFFRILNLKAYDAHFIVRDFLRGLVGRRPLVSDIVLLTADKKAYDTFPELRVFWNQHYATAIRAAGQAGAKVIALDLAFGVPIDQWQPGADELLAGAISTSPVPVVVGYVSEINSNQQSQSIPVNMMAAALGLGAFANLTTDDDDFIRNQELIEASSANPADPPSARSLAMRTVEKYIGTDAQFQKGELALNGHAVPISPARSIAINYAGGPNTFPSVSLADFEAAAKAGNQDQLRKWVNGKIVLVGTDFVDDRFDTPFYTLFSGSKWTMPGVEIHANTIRTLLTRSYLVPAPQWGLALALLLATSATVWIVTSFAAGRAVGLVLLEVLGILAATHLLFERGFVLSTSEVLLATSVSLVASLVYRYATEETRGNLFHRAVSLFVGKQLASSLEESDGIALSGKRMEVTILFTDIRGFTAFTEQVSEEQGPEVVVQLLNEYMSLMVGIIVMYHGHVNKFIGDGILAVFSDDDEGVEPGDHALRAVRCATRMVTARNRFETGAGIHTGPAVVGNVGSADKMEYTVLGDTVNLASRLESLNKEHHTKLLMTGTTQARLGSLVETSHLGQAPVRGKALPIDLYTVTSLVVKAAVNA